MKEIIRKNSESDKKISRWKWSSLTLKCRASFSLMSSTIQIFWWLWSKKWKCDPHLLQRTNLLESYLQLSSCNSKFSYVIISVQPLLTFGQRNLRLPRMFTIILDIGFNWSIDNSERHVGQVLFPTFSHFRTQNSQKWWSQGVDTGFNNTRKQIEHMKSGLTSSRNWSGCTPADIYLQFFRLNFRFSNPNIYHNFNLAHQN